MITQETILARTHYGVQIYAHILRQFYPNETVIKVTERDCGLCRNPFTNGTPTLHIQIIKLNPTQKISPEKAVHKDILEAIPAGDCFTFAELFYNLSGKELLNKINQELNLRLTEGITLISFFKAPITNTKPCQSITLTEVYHYITGNTAKQRTEILRAIRDSKKARLYKAANFDYCTFSGTFTSRNDKALLQHSGLLCLDFDHIPNIEHTFIQLKADKNLQTKLLFRSPSGDGLKWIIAIDLLKATHTEYFKAVSNYIRKTYHLEVDKSGKDISRACFLPYDPFAYINL